MTYPFFVPSGVSIYPEISGAQALGTASSPFANIYTDQLIVSGTAISSSGASGYSGFSGYSGPTGISGFSGYSGPTGVSGFSGYSGPTGISGFSGYSGPTGVSGFSGFSGFSGPTGTSGLEKPASTTSSGIAIWSGTGAAGLLNTNITIDNANLGVMTLPSGGSILNSVSGINILGSVSNPFSGIFASTIIGETRMLNYVIDGGGSTIASGSAGFVEIPYNMNALSWDLLGNTSGSLSVDVRRATYASWSGTGIAVGNSIVGSEKPTISSAFKGQDTALTTWSGISTGDILEFFVDATPSGISRATLALRLRRNS
jgi:hypothetical protein